MKDQKLIVANWKMNPVSLDAARRLAMGVEHRMHQFHGKAEAVVCAPYVFLPALSQYFHFLRLGAQNASWDETGALTGEVSPLQLRGFGVQYVILGHSERRINFGETDGSVMLKLAEAVKHKLTPVLCLGGDKNATKATMKRLVSKQFKDCLAGLEKKEWHKVVFAYEPSWAISTAKQAEAATPEHAGELIGYTRALLKKAIGGHASETVRILYGGSVNEQNAAGFAATAGIDGALVGGASLDPDSFAEIIRAFARVAAEKH